MILFIVGYMEQSPDKEKLLPANTFLRFKFNSCGQKMRQRTCCFYEYHNTLQRRGKWWTVCSLNPII